MLLHISIQCNPKSQMKDTPNHHNGKPSTCGKQRRNLLCAYLRCFSSRII